MFVHMNIAIVLLVVFYKFYFGVDWIEAGVATALMWLVAAGLVDYLYEGFKFISGIIKKS